MPIILTCPQCRQPQSAPDSAAGKAGRCGCGAVLRIPPRKIAEPPPASSLFDELSAADLDRLQNRTPAPAAEPPPHPNPYQSPVAQYLARAAASQRHVTRGEGPWLTWAVVAGLIGTVIIIVPLGFWGVLKILNETQFDRAQRLARMGEFGRGLGWLTVMVWLPATSLLGRRLGKWLSGRES